jgi:REP element-mobilizing transposase RayT
MHDPLRPNNGAATPSDGRGGHGNKQKAAHSNPEDPFKDDAARNPDVNGSVLLEPLNRRDYDLSYACLLIPRADSHLLTGKVTEFLHTTIRQICGLFGWRLDFIQIRPEYLQWVVSAPAATPPSRCIRMIREQTSKGILDRFHEFRDKSPHQDFWAPGYLVLVGPAPHPAEVISEFILLTRQQQALGRQSSK